MECGRAGDALKRASVRPPPIPRWCSSRQRITRKRACQPLACSPTPFPAPAPATTAPLHGGSFGLPGVGQPAALVPLPGLRRAGPQVACLSETPLRGERRGEGGGGTAGHSRRAICDRRERPEDWERRGRSPGPGGNLVGEPRGLSTDRAGGPFASVASRPEDEGRSAAWGRSPGGPGL